MQCVYLQQEREHFVWQVLRNFGAAPQRLPIAARTAIRPVAFVARQPINSHSLIEGGDLPLRNLRVRPHETKGMNGLLFLLKKLSQSDYFAELSASTKAGVLRHRPSEVA
jgi:hypothetical protein